MLKLELIQKTLKTEVVGARVESFDSVSTDSRTVGERALFVALRGPTHNGHDFIGAAFDRGAAGAVIERAFIERARVMLGRKIQKFTLVPVPDTLQALGDLASAHRAQFGVRVAAVTGSNGKTTTKEMIAAILSEVGTVLKTEGNFNNLIGLPLTVFGIGPSHDFAVLEMGMSQPGEIRRLAQITRPNAAVVTNVHPAHLEGMGTVEVIADEKWQIYGGLGDDGTAVVNMDDPVLAARAAGIQGKKLTFGTGPKCDVRLSSVESRGAGGQRLVLNIKGGRVEAHIPHLGRHNALNATGAAAAAVALGAEIDCIPAGLETVEIVPRRLQHEVVGGVHVINDAYNANPKSMEGAIDTLCVLAGGARTFAVLGDMLELGPRSAELHEELGRVIAEKKVTVLVVLGTESANTARGAIAAGMDQGACFKAVDAPDAAWLLRKRARPGDWVLIKGSRGMKMELVFEQFKSSFAGA